MGLMARYGVQFVVLVNHKNIELLNLIDGIEGIIVTRDGSVLMTSKNAKVFIKFKEYS